eukprot:9182367-Pyramimonas_sp.AAC.1
MQHCSVSMARCPQLSAGEREQLQQTIPYPAMFEYVPARRVFRACVTSTFLTARLRQQWLRKAGVQTRG